MNEEQNNQVQGEQVPPQQSQQPQYQQPYASARPAPSGNRKIPTVPVSPRDVEGTFKVGGSILMLILAIIVSVSWLSDLINAITAFNIFNILMTIPTIFLPIGLWLIWANARSRKMNPKGSKFALFTVTWNQVIRMIGLVCCAIGCVVLFSIVVAGAVALDAVSDALPAILVCAIPVIASIVMIVFWNKYYQSIAVCLKNVTCIMSGQPVRFENGGKFASTIMIIVGVLTILPSLGLLILTTAGANILHDILSNLGDLPPELMEMINGLLNMLKAGAVGSFIVSLISSARYFVSAALLLNYNKELN